MTMAQPRTNQRLVRQGLLFVAISGLGWLIDVTVFMTLSGPADWTPVAANFASGSCGSLFVFIVSATGIFQRNEGGMAQKTLVLLTFNLVVIYASSFLLGLIVTGLQAAAQDHGWVVQPAAIRLLAKVIVTPATLLLNFLVVRFLVERFVGVRRQAASTPGERVV